ncbi:MAG: bifunctional [glutamine synthetase] adenylyltransferase/[glutamine synthetase]-adenylyl-L-tyrosine phosphorylase [Bauldia litoralis]|uniref:bifunctional [glutamine synthetase] adenylyltransferase/[glutamine synthetase]-adenylyl-L-tyrosine phosphorylase n=1 Tax=Bauldia litoralis TaxID=665467 RepID=UPI003299C2A7
MASATKRKPSARSSLAAQIEPRLRLAKAADRKARLAELYEAAEEAGVAARLKTLLDRHDGLGAFVASVSEYAPFLRSLMLGEPARLIALLGKNPKGSLDRLVTGTADAWRLDDRDALMAALRRARQEAALLIGLADLGGVWSVSDVVAALSGFADASVAATARFLLSELHREGKIKLPVPEQPDVGSGWIILGMGKSGAGELNYSSDIDLIVLFDHDVAPLADPDEAAAVFIRLTKQLVHILSEHTADGYVFRTDLRLRPDPGATNIAISTEAALQYYESFGQNWERAALIKARPVAGDVAAGEAFLAELTPYIWRKYLDYAAIADIHSIKRQIHDFRGHEEIAVAGHNIKLGRGGIREIEFFVQTQQLIAGGRNPELRGRATLDMLAGLAEGGWIDEQARDDMSASYCELRQIEHCLQMINDEQTHTLPATDEELDVVARMGGARSLAAFKKALPVTLARVRDRYGELFEAAPSLTSKLGSLVFTGDDDDPDTLNTLEGLGFRTPEQVSRTIRTWHYGRYPATRSTAARERLTEFVPALLETLATTDNADAALAAFDRFLSRLPAGVQLFSLLTSNPSLLGLLATMMASAPRMTEVVVHRAHVLDALIEPAFFGRVPSRETLEPRLAASLEEAPDYEDILDRARIFGQEQAFLIGVRVLAGTLDAGRAGIAFTDLADVLVSALFDAARREFESIHGKIAKGKVAVVAMGKLGGREMTAASDLDLIFLYDFDEKASESSGDRPLAAAQYFARLTQRLLAALSAPTAEGTLYEVDFRLRPSGNSGPLATHIDAFATYQAKDAWTWEHMALTRARPIAGDKALMTRAAKEIAGALAQKRQPKKTRASILDMRALLEQEKGGGGAWDLKQAPGGLVDIEFIAQYLQLTRGVQHPEILSTETEASLAAATKAGVLSRGDSEILLPALRLHQTLMQILRLCVEEPFDPEKVPRGMLELLARAAAMPDFARLDHHLRETEAAVRACFERLIGPLSAASEQTE